MIKLFSVNKIFVSVTGTWSFYYDMDFHREQTGTFFYIKKQVAGKGWNFALYGTGTDSWYGTV